MARHDGSVGRGSDALPETVAPVSSVSSSVLLPRSAARVSTQLGSAYGAIARELKRVANRGWREVIARVPPVGWAVEQRYEHRLRNYRDQLAPLPSLQRRLLSEVANTGVALTSLDTLGLSGTETLKESLARLAPRLDAHPSTEISCTWATRPELLDEIDLWHWGLREDVLDLVEGYLKLPARYDGPEVRRELADGRQAEVRQWHRDIEDHRVFKLLVWIDDVGPKDGAFEWIPRNLTDATTRKLHYVSGYRTEREMAAVATPTLWRKAEGPRWTTVLADTRNVFHRAGTPHYKDRYSVTFKWTSRSPVKTMPAERFTSVESAKLRNGLNARQLACLPVELS